MVVIDGVAVLVIGTAIVGLVRWLLRERLGWFRSRPEPSDRVGEVATASDAETFNKERFRLPSTAYVPTSFQISNIAAGAEARAVPRAIAKGKGLVVILQDWELSAIGVGVWLSVANPSERTYRWFGAILTAYDPAPVSRTVCFLDDHAASVTCPHSLVHS